MEVLLIGVLVVLLPGLLVAPVVILAALFGAFDG